MRFDWDSDKSDRNAKIHSITFEETTALFTSGVPVFEIYDPDDDVIRIISAWKATKSEKKMYEEFLEVRGD